MERHELHDKIVQQLRFHRISGLDEEECANNILSIVQEDWTEGCSCYHGDTTGETWCCNTCGKPTPRLSTGLPSDEEKPALQPLPEKMPDWLPFARRTLSGNDVWNKIREHFGTQPREWWMDLKWGDKFLLNKGDGFEEKIFRGIIYLSAAGDEICNHSYCAPYTPPSPLDQLLSTFTPEQKALWDQVKEGKDE